MTRYTPEEVARLLERDEGLFLEFKSLWDRSGDTQRTVERRAVRDAIAECVAAFANADGGDLVLGVEDDGTPSGHAYPNDVIDEFFRVPEKRLRPAVRVRTQRVLLDQTEVLVISVDPAERAVLVEGDGFPYRVGDRTVLEREESINARKEAYRRVGHEQLVRPEAGLDDLDLELARATLARAVRGGRTIEEALEAYALIHRGPRGARVTNAALLLFGRLPLGRWHPRAEIRFFRVKGTERRHGTARNVTQLERLESPVVRLIPDAHRYASGQIRKSERLHSLFFREMPEYPEFAWQEAIINAVAHRDYANQTAGIEIWFYDDRMEVASPGLLVPPVTLEALRKRTPVHASRNPLMVRVLVEAGLMREEGEGIPRMYDETDAVLLKPPAFREEAGSFVVTLFNTPLFEGVGPEWQRIVDGLALSPSQKRVLLLKPEGFTNEDYRNLNSGLDRDAAYREIQEMVASGLLVAPGRPGRGATYRVSASMLEARRWLEQRLPRLRDYLQGHPFVRNLDYRGLFGVPRYRAVAELHRLADGGYLRLEGAGRGARYTAGPRLGPQRE